MNLAASLDHSVTRHAANLAVVDGDRRISYLELYRRAEALCRVLTDAGVARGDRIACVSRNRLEMLELLYACAKSSLTCAFLNFRLAVNEIDWILRDCDPAFVVYEDAYRPSAHLEAASGLRGALSLDEGSPEQRYEEAVSRAGGDDVPWTGVLEEDRADTPVLILYTSGTTGRPKGAVHTHRSLLSMLLNIQAHMAYGPGDVSLAILPLCHVASLQMHALPTLLCGGTLVVEREFDAGEMADTLVREGVTATLFLVQQWTELEALTAEEGIVLDRLRWLITGSQPTALPIVRGILRMAPNGEYALIYGMTEVGTCTTLLDNASMLARPQSIGRPTVLASVAVVDESGRAVPSGTTGEIVHRGPAVCTGYWNRPEATAETIRDGALYSGDLAERDDDGYLYIVDRKKDMIKSGGENVYSVEVENVLRTHPQVDDVAVIGVPDVQWGEMVKAYVVTDGELDPEDLRRFCGARIAGYKKPKVVEFVTELPRSATGKVDKRLLRSGAGWPGREAVR